MLGAQDRPLHPYHEMTRFVKADLVNLADVAVARGGYIVVREASQSWQRKGILESFPNFCTVLRTLKVDSLVRFAAGAT